MRLFYHDGDNAETDYFWPVFEGWSSAAVAGISLLLSLLSVWVTVVTIGYDSEFNRRSTLLTKFSVTIHWLYVLWMPAQVVDTYRFVSGQPIHPMVCYYYVIYRQGFSNITKCIKSNLILYVFAYKF